LTQPTKFRALRIDKKATVLMFRSAPAGKSF
jgi:hypothetical protein